MTDGCPRCGKFAKATKHGICLACWRKEGIARSLQRLAAGFKPASEYNRYLFELFLINVRRCQGKQQFVPEAKLLITLLERAPVPPLLSWPKIYELRQSNKASFHHGSHPLYRVGLMLQELGVIEPRSQMRKRRFDALLSQFDASTGAMLTEFADTMRRLRRGENTILGYWRELRDLQTLCRQRTGATLLTLTGKEMGAYLGEIASRHTRSGAAHSAYYRLHRFYRWCLARKKILRHPLTDLDPPPLRTMRHVVCSNEDISRLFAFIRDPSSPVDLAFLLALIIFWGIAVQELIRADLQTNEKKLEIHFRRAVPTHRQYPRRAENLPLPITPAWFYDLQKRYFAYWQAVYTKSKKTFPGQPLFLHPLGHHARPMSHLWIETRVRIATEKATGRTIPISVLRQTCARLHIRGCDASLLRELGWSTQTAAIYTWAPRQIYAGERHPARGRPRKRPVKEV
jgi:hypothetical protein